MVEESPDKPIVSKGLLDVAVTDIFNDLMEVETYRVTHDIGRRLRFNEIPPFEDEESQNGPVNVHGYDIFGEPLTKKYNFECECPNCGRNLAASRFAPHLEKCMGMGRNSSRIASRRLAASSQSNNHLQLNSFTDGPSSSKATAAALAAVGSSGSQNGDIISEDEHFVDDDEDDEEWTMEKKTKKTKKANDKTANKRKWAVNRVRNTEGRGRRSGPPSFNNSPVSTFSDPGIDEDAEVPLAMSH